MSEAEVPASPPTAPVPEAPKWRRARSRTGDAAGHASGVGECGGAGGGDEFAARSGDVSAAAAQERLSDGSVFHSFFLKGLSYGFYW